MQVGGCVAGEPVRRENPVSEGREVGQRLAWGGRIAWGEKWSREPVGSDDFLSGHVEKWVRRFGESRSRCEWCCGLRELPSRLRGRPLERILLLTNRSPRGWAVDRKRGDPVKQKLKVSLLFFQDCM